MKAGSVSKSGSAQKPLMMAMISKPPWNASRKRDHSIDRRC